jgi:septal ring factor EnvC (AmiA/AmiB activator)
MKYLLCILVYCVAFDGLYAAEVPPYVQTQVDSLTMQIKELEMQRQLLQRELVKLETQEDTSGISMGKDQVKAQIEQLNAQIKSLEQQRQALLQSYQ